MSRKRAGRGATISPPNRRRRWPWLLAAAAALAVLWFGVTRAGTPVPVRAAVDVDAAGSVFRPTVENPTLAGPAPAGMVWIPGGEFSMGANDPPDMDEVGMKATADARSHAGAWKVDEGGCICH